jgi:5-formyltetrahydrofolate cyclo-ligase
MKPTKSELRQALKQARLEMLDEDHRLSSQAIVERLKQAIDWSKVKSVHYFEPIRGLVEVDISPFVTYLEDKYPKLQLSTSRLIEDKWELVGVHGGAPPEKFDVIIVPMLGFDPKTLHRIGYGGGYYDKFLSSQPRAKKIGVCFEVGKIDKLPHEPTDIPLGKIITEQFAYER